MPEVWLGGDPACVFILIPLSVLFNVQFFISVGAVVRGKYTNIFGLDVLGQNDGYVETHGIDRCDLSYNPIDYVIELICRLHHK
jgi:hypothetical protein